jgi:hypothetical protein
MKRLFVLLALLPFASNAQLLLGGKNIIKTNLSSLVANNYHFTYERHIFKPLSVSLSYRFMPSTKVPLQSYVEKFLDNPNVNVGGFTMSGNAITPEVRLYLGIGRMKGFYISGYYRMSNFDLSVPISYKTTFSANTYTKSTTVGGTIKGNAGGLMIGIQKNIAKILVLDFWIIGGHYGSSTGDLSASITESYAGSLSTEQDAAINELKRTTTTPFEFTYSKTGTSPSGTIKAASTGPWAGIRGAGLCLGIRF